MPKQVRPKKLFIESLFSAGEFVLPILTRRWLWLLTTLALGLSCELYFEHMMQKSQYNDLLRIMSQLGLALSALLVSLLVLFIAPLTIEDELKERESRSVWAFSHHHFWPLTLESFRALSHVLLFIGFFALFCALALAGVYIYLLPLLQSDNIRLIVTTSIVVAFLILPGFYKFLRLHFMPYIIMFDPHYEAGDVNAIHRSHELTKPILGWLFLFMLIGTLIELALDIPPQLLNGTARTLARLAISPLTIVFSVYSVSVSYFLFQKMNEHLAHRELSKPGDSDNPEESQSTGDASH